MSGKQKRRQLDSRREATRIATERRRLAKLRQAGRIVRGTVIPEDAVAANPEQQAPNNSYSDVLYYVDQPFTCRDCGREEVWTATQQKWYYEVAKGSIYARAARCRPCRRKHRESKQHR